MHELYIVAANLTASHVPILPKTFTIPILALRRNGS
jgi:hypothetical protein